MAYVFAFDHKHRKPPMSLKDLLGGKGANLAEMTSVLKLPVPPGFTITTDACRDYMHGGWPKRLDGEIAKALTSSRRRWAKPRRRRRPAAGQRPLGRQVLDARDDGHGPQPRPQRRLGRRSCQADRRRALRLRLLPPLHRHVRPHRARRRRRGVRPPARHGQGMGRRHGRQRHQRGHPAPPRASATRIVARTHRPSRSRRSRRPAAGRDRGRLPSWNGARAVAYRDRERIAHDLGTAVNVQAMVFGNRDDNSRHRRRLHPRPGHRRAGRLRRLPRQRPGRGRGGRHPQHRAAVRAQGQVPEDPQAS